MSDIGISMIGGLADSLYAAVRTGTPGWFDDSGVMLYQ
jgi:hypothetical protein